MRFVIFAMRDSWKEKIYFYSREKRRRYLCSNNCIHRQLTSNRQEKKHHMHNASQTDVRCPILVTQERAVKVRDQSFILGVSIKHRYCDRLIVKYLD